MANARPSLAFRALAQQVVIDCEKIHKDLTDDKKNAGNQTIAKIGEKLKHFSAAVKGIDHFEASEQKRSEFRLKKQTKESCNIPEARLALDKLQFLRSDNTVHKKYAARIANIKAELNPAEPGFWDFAAGFAKEFAEGWRDTFEPDDKQKPKVAAQPVAQLKKPKEQLEAELKAVIAQREKEQKDFLHQVESECTNTLDQINRRIELQKQLFFAGISYQMMMECLSVYACFIELRDALLENYFVAGMEDLRSSISKFAPQITELFKALWCPDAGSKTAMEIYEQYKKLGPDAKKIVLEEGGERFVEKMEKIIPKTNTSIKLVDLKTKLVYDIPPRLKANQRRSFVSWMFGEVAVVAPVDVAPVLTATQLPSPRSQTASM